jgi:predicted NodU family carbamoyl transferase
MSHDASITVWDVEHDITMVFEFEKMSRIKHFEGRRLHRPWNADNEHLVNLMAEEFARNNTKTEFVINWYYPFHFPERGLNGQGRGLDPRAPGTFWQLFLDTFDVVISNPEGFKRSVHHQDHAASGFFQSPFEKAFIVTHDCWAVQSCFCLWTADRSRTREPLRLIKNVYDGFGAKKQEYLKKFPKNTRDNYNVKSHEVHDGWRMSPGRLYSEVGLNLRTVASKTHNYFDVSGKLMGLSSYGNRESEVYKKWVDRFINNDMESYAFDDIFPWWMTSNQYTVWDRLPDEMRRGKKGEYIDRYPKGYESYPEKNAWVRKMGEKSDLTLQEEQDIALTAQDSFVKCVLEQVEQFDFLIEECDNNIVVSGGSALNLFCNKALKDKYNANVYVPSNPDDQGLSTGSYLWWRHSKTNKKVYKQKDLTFEGGMHLWDLDNLDHYKDKYPHEKTDVNKIASLLSNAKIVGLCQGKHELGKRALGNRSILGDASVLNMKEVINRIKNREFYRPFAPVCRLEDAPKWFEGPPEDFWMYSTMNLVTNVKKEVQGILPAITHVDGTARLQTVTREQNAFLHDLLSVNENVLLNTSFNVSGSPILNTLEEAFTVLTKTELDYLVIVDRDNQPWLFENE